jgi:multiple sugar transport system permease protein
MARSLAALFLVAFVLAPFAMTVVASVTPDVAIVSRPPAWFSHGFTLDNYRYIFTGHIPAQYKVSGAGGRSFSMISEEIRQLPFAMWRSALVAGVVMVVNIALGSAAAYAIARLNFRGKATALNALMASKLIPVVAIAIPYYALMQKFALTDNLLSLVLIHSALTLPITVLFLAASIRRIDPTIDEAAGLNPLQTLYRVILPLARPSLVGAALFAFMLSYSEFLFALLLASNQSVRTLPVTLASVSVNPDVSLGLITAGVVVGIAPTLLLIVPIWKLMISGLVEGATKG